MDEQREQQDEGQRPVSTGELADAELEQAAGGALLLPAIQAAREAARSEYPLYQDVVFTS